MSNVETEARRSSTGSGALALQACFLFSGAAALSYQMTWTRQFALVLGTSELAVASVLAAYMAGLALGALLVEHWLPRITRPVRAYAALEAGIAVSAVLLVPTCLWLARAALLALLGHQPDLPGRQGVVGTLLYPASAIATLLVPTALMGATLPLLARAGVRTERDIGERIGALYAWNTVGSVAGALLTSTLLLPRFGLRATQWMAGATNLVVCLVALWFVPDIRPLETGRVDRVRSAIPTGDGFLILPLMAVSGAVMFTHEVLWTRLLQRIVGGSVLAFGVMVSAFLLGIALGGAAGARLAVRRETALRAWVAAQVLAASAAIAAWYVLPACASTGSSFWVRALVCGALLLPLSFAGGLTYPAAVRILAPDAAGAPLASARVYAWNTTGAIVGALVGGYILLPWLRYEGTMATATAAALLLAVAAAQFIWKPGWRWTTGLAALALAAGIAFRPAPPEALLRHSPVNGTNGPILYYGVGRSADIVLTDEPGAIGMLGNGLPEASITRAGHPPTASAEGWMGALASLARPSAASVLVIGYGGGNAVAAIAPAVARIDVLELEPEVLRANRDSAALREGNPLLDARVHVTIDDARGALALTSARYDAILSQPSHPWTAGASHLYTREFVQQVRGHLNPGGLFVQWMGAEFLDARLLRDWLATVHAVLPQVRLYRTSDTALVLLASDTPFEPEHDTARLRELLERDPDYYGRLGIVAPEDLLAALALDSNGVATLAAGGEPITDDRNRFATAGLQECRCGLDGRHLGELLQPLDPVAGGNGTLLREREDPIDVDYLWRKARSREGARTSEGDRSRRIVEALGDTEQGIFLQYSQARMDQDEAAAEQLLRSALARWPGSGLFRYAFVEQRFAELSQQKLPGDLQQAINHLEGEPGLVVRALRAASREDWASVAAADKQLATVPLPSPWGYLAAQLRVEWRARVGNASLRRRYAEEALAIVDRVLPSQPTPTWHALRALSASGALQDVQLASTEDFLASCQAAFGRMSPGERQVAAGYAASLARILPPIDPGRDPGRERALAAGLQALALRLR